jgi:UDP:flavonoid glycosyltransferase YjiC (YdhE family)
MTTETTTNKLIVILDTIGRTILGEKTESPVGFINIKNPVILHIVPADNNGKMSVQLLPLFFREFLADKTGDVTLTYQADKVTTTDIDALDFRLQGQYSQMFNPQNAFVAPDTNASPASDEAPKVVNLFDE